MSLSNPNRIRSCRGLALCVALFFFSTLPVWSGDERYALIDIDRVGPDRVAALKQNPAFAWWVEMGPSLLVLASDAELQSLIRNAAADAPVIRVFADVGVDRERLYVVKLDHFRTLPNLDGIELARAGRRAVVQMYAEPPRHLAHGAHAHDLDFRRLEPFSVLAAQHENRTAQQHKRAPDPAIQAVVDQIDGDRWLGDVTRLAEFNRYSLGTEIADSRDWLIGQFQAIEGLTVSTQGFTFSGTNVQNVIAVIEGTERPDDWYIIGGHYDSISEDPTNAAPGAEDNGSGTAGVLEMARVLAAAKPKSTILFIAYSGEEQGLFGSFDHAARLAGNDDLSKVKGVLIMDMIGYTGDEDLDVLLESGQVGASLVEAFSTAATDYTNLRVVTSFNPFGSDHVPYINRGVPALLTIENDWDSYSGYHRTTDTADNVSISMGLEVLKMNVAAMAEMVGIENGGSGFEAVGRWMYSWLSYTDRFESTLVANNYGSTAAQVELTARRTDGSTATASRTIPANGFLEEGVATLFPNFDRGPGFTVELAADRTTIHGRWVTFNRDTDSGLSPSQGVAVAMPENGTMEGTRYGRTILFGYLPVIDGNISAPVIVNVGAAATDVTLTFHNAAGDLLRTDTETGRGLAPGVPVAVTTDGLFPGIDQNVTMTATSADQPLTGVVFVFNQIGEPAIGNVSATSNPTP